MTKKPPEWFNMSSNFFIEVIIAITAGLILLYFIDNPIINIIIILFFGILAISFLILKNIWGKIKESRIVIGITILLLFAILIIGGVIINAQGQPSPSEIADTQIALTLAQATQISYDVATAQALGRQQQSNKETATFQAIYRAVATQDKLTADVSSVQTQFASEKTQTQSAVLGTIVANDTAIVQMTEIASYLGTKSVQDREQSIQATAQALVKTQEAQTSATQAVQQATSDWISNHSFNDDFSNDGNDWSGTSNTYNVNVTDGMLNIHVEPEFPTDDFIWSCSSCFIPTDYTNYSFEAVMRPPQNANSFVGIIFGSNKKIGNNVDIYVAKLSTAGSFYLYRTSTEGLTEKVIEIPFRDTLVGTFRNSLSIRIDVKNGSADFYVNDVRLQESPVSLKSPVNGFFGIFIQYPKGDIKFDSIHIRPYP